MRAKPHKPKHKRPDSDESIHAKQPVATLAKEVSDDELFTAPIYSFESRRPVFEVVFPDRALRHRPLFETLVSEKVKVEDFGRSSDGTNVCYFEHKMEAKLIRDLANEAMAEDGPRVVVSAGPLHHTRVM